MKKVLVLGINGTFGRHVAAVLANQGWVLKTMMRDVKKLPSQFAGIKVVSGHASSYEDVKQAAEDMDMIIYSVNPANYDWEGKALPWLDVSARVAEEQRLTLVFPGNVYNFNPQDACLIHESSKQSPLTCRGEIRKHMELRLQRAAKNGAKILILRMGDFIANQPSSLWLSRILSEAKDEVILEAPGSLCVKHAWAYVPDAAATVGLLVEKLDELPAFNVFHFSGYTVSLDELANIIAEKTEKPVLIKSMAWWFLFLLRPFMKAIQGVFEMRYLWQEELLLDDTKLRQTIGHVPHTDIGQALVDSGLVVLK